MVRGGAAVLVARCLVMVHMTSAFSTGGTAAHQPTYWGSPLPYPDKRHPDAILKTAKPFNEQAQQCPTSAKVMEIAECLMWTVLEPPSQPSPEVLCPHTFLKRSWDWYSEVMNLEEFVGLVPDGTLAYLETVWEKDKYWFEWLVEACGWKVDSIML